MKSQYHDFVIIHNLLSQTTAALRISNIDGWEEIKCYWVFVRIFLYKFCQKMQQFLRVLITGWCTQAKTVGLSRSKRLQIPIKVECQGPDLSFQVEQWKKQTKCMNVFWDIGQSASKTQGSSLKDGKRKTWASWMALCPAWGQAMVQEGGTAWALVTSLCWSDRAGSPEKRRPLEFLGESLRREGWRGEEP